MKENWDDTYMDEKYNPSLIFQGDIVDKKKAQTITWALPKVAASWENLHNDIRVTQVWFLQKKGKGDRFEKFHYDC
jgi:hypothetical protein